MKIFAAILGIFFLCLAAMPCADAAPSEETVIELSQEHNHEGDMADNCAPLCYCHCCHVHVTISNDYPKFSAITLLNEYTNFYSKAEPEALTYPPFRPPMV